jgi:hypothetical protein
MAKTVTIRVSEEMRDFLVNQSINKRETYDKILKRLMGKAYGVKFTDTVPEVKP